MVFTQSISNLADTSSLHSAIDKAWFNTWSKFYHPSTHQFYDYLSSYESGLELDHLPTPSDVKKQVPNIYGYDTGMEDCMISAGIIMEMIIDKFYVTKDYDLTKYAEIVYKGIKLSATVHEVPGFLARCVCVGDRKSIYINSSRDQYTHAMIALWKYYRSPLSNPTIRSEIEFLVTSIAEMLRLNVIIENDFDMLRADGTKDTRGISRMWDVQPHEAGRLPMMYAIAWDITGERNYYLLYQKFAHLAIAQSSKINFDKHPTYALLQMQSSLEVLGYFESDVNYANIINTIMYNLSNYITKRIANVIGDSDNYDLTLVGSDWKGWRSDGGLRPGSDYRKVWYNIREGGEALLIHLIYKNVDFTTINFELFSKAILQIDYDKVSSNGIFYLQAAYWKALRYGKI